jgi:hypothetical protein
MSGVSLARAGPLAAATSLALLVPVGEAQVRPPHHDRQVFRTGELHTYEARYGAPELRPLDDPLDPAENWPRLRSIRTRGRLQRIPPGGGTTPLAWANPLTTHMACSWTRCLALTPVEEMGGAFERHAALLEGREVIVVGAVDQWFDNPDPSRPVWGFFVWSIEVAGEFGARGGQPEPGLEALLTGAAPGRTVTVTGVFRGANLFEDLPPESRPRPSAWVLKEGAFTVWVTGRAPRGSGFSLDPASRADCAWRLEVTGRVERQGEQVHLRARKVRLLGRLKDEAS